MKTKILNKIVALGTVSLMTTACVPASSAMTEDIKADSVIELSDSEILVDGEKASTDSSSAVYTGADIIYYEGGTDESYGAGTEAEKHSAEEAAANTVVTITEPGTYEIKGTLSNGQLAIDLGEDAEDDPNAVVTLVLDGVDINCSVAPAVIFYNVYECGSGDTETATSDVDTSAAGANVIIADGTVNNITGSHVAKIYKDGTTDKKYKFDGAFYSKMSMNIDGGTLGTGRLNITADNEGLDSELHLTINGGIIHINSADDGINTNEDGVSVTTINDGYLYIFAGNGAEGDGIDSNGWIVINGGTVISLANPNSMDGGIDSDMGTYINGGTVVGAGGMYDEIENDSEQLFMFMQFAEDTDDTIVVTDENDNPVFAYDFPYDYTYIVFSTPELAEGTYHVYRGGSIEGTEEDGLYTSITSYTDGTQLKHGGELKGGMNGEPPVRSDNNGGMAEMPENAPNSDGTQPTPPEKPKNTNNSEGSSDSSKTPPEKPENEPNTDNSQTTPPEKTDGNGEPKEKPEGGFGGSLGMNNSNEEESTDFVLTTEAGSFTNVTYSEGATESTKTTAA